MFWGTGGSGCDVMDTDIDIFPQETEVRKVGHCAWVKKSLMTTRTCPKFGSWNDNSSSHGGTKDAYCFFISTDRTSKHHLDSSISIDIQDPIIIDGALCRGDHLQAFPAITSLKDLLRSGLWIHPPSSPSCRQCLSVQTDFNIPTMG